MGFMFNLSHSIRFAENAGKYGMPSGSVVLEMTGCEERH